MYFLRKFVMPLMLLFTAVVVKAQEQWPSQEVAQMYRNARENMMRGNMADATITLKQAISLAPDRVVLYRDLAEALYLLHKYDEAEDILAALVTKEVADTSCFRILAASQSAQGKYKNAQATLQQGIKRFPTAGALYRELGLVYLARQKPLPALDAWLDGIKNNAVYAPNYYEAAIVYLASDNVLWGLLYGEIFLNISTDTAGAGAFKRMLLEGYKTMFKSVVKEGPEYGKRKVKKKAHNFTDEVLGIYASLTPITSDGFTVENLTMLRTRFLMEWFSGRDKKYPFSLFDYQHELVRSGHFDIYNEMIFGKAVSEAEFSSWNQFHEGDMERFAAWQIKHQLQPKAIGF
jgi:tetratricopeptide (TPR) repeat protein